MLILFPFFRELEIHGNRAVLLPPRRHNGRVKYGPSNLAVHSRGEDFDESHPRQPGINPKLRRSTIILLLEERSVRDSRAEKGLFRFCFGMLVNINQIL